MGRADFRTGAPPPCALRGHKRQTVFAGAQLRVIFETFCSAEDSKRATPSFRRGPCWRPTPPRMLPCRRIIIMTKAPPFTREPTVPRRSRALPFTVASLTRAIKGVEAAGRFVVGVKPDGTLIVDDKPIDTAFLVSSEPQPSSVPQTPRFGDRILGDQSPKRPEDYFNNTASNPGVAAPSSEGAAPRRAYDILTSRRRGGSWGSVVTIDDPELIERYRAAGFALYKEGELDELVRKTPMGKRETAALGGFFRAQGEPVEVKGARGQITSRLVTRGYIEEAEGKHRITPAGETEWLRLANKTPADQS
jgi:hypothetical protein